MFANDFGYTYFYRCCSIELLKFIHCNFLLLWVDFYGGIKLNGLNENSNIVNTFFCNTLNFYRDAWEVMKIIGGIFSERYLQNNFGNSNIKNQNGYWFLKKIMMLCALYGKNYVHI